MTAAISNDSRATQAAQCQVAPASQSGAKSGAGDHFAATLQSLLPGGITPAQWPLQAGPTFGGPGFGGGHHNGGLLSILGDGTG